MNIEVSVCIPAYNNIDSFKRCINSILIQTFINYEIIITDDSDNDDIKIFLEKCSDNRIKYFKNPIRLGSPKNWNYAIMMSSGKFIKLMHHDDMFTFQDSLQKFYNLLSDNDHILGFVASRNVNHLLNEVVSINLPSRTFLKKLSANPNVLLLGNFIGSPSATIFRRSHLLFDNNLRWLVDIDFYMANLNHSNSFNYLLTDEITIGISKTQITNSVRDCLKINVYEFFYILNKYKIKYVFNNTYQSAVVNLLLRFNIRNLKTIKNIYSNLPEDLSSFFSFSFQFKLYFFKRLQVLLKFLISRFSLGVINLIIL